ncbi:Quinone-oxidoreductase, chloroplastic [Glycine max]|nr:Quinone-oxidoreductase, chloroplastic [Glycine max]
MHSVIGSDVTGEVVEVGQGVRKFKPGDKVVALVNPFSGGGLAKFVVAKKNILINAALGGVGHYALQLAKLGNTHVTATCGAHNIVLVKSLGADEVIDNKTQMKYDDVIHCAVCIPWSTFEPNLTMNGKVIDITPSSASMLKFALKKLTFSKKQLVPLVAFPKGKGLQ